mgnify:CR=1 FL=1
MRGQRVEGRFSIDSERESIISGTNSELVFTVGQYVQWWFYDEKKTVIDPVYDVGAASGGRWFNGLEFKLHDWIVFRPSDGWSITVVGILCRMLNDVDVRALIDNPDQVY